MPDKQKRRFPLFVVGVFVLALVVRLAPVIAARDLPIGLDDMFQYDMLARSLAAGEGYRWYAEEDLALIESYFPLDFVYGDYDPRGIVTSFRPPAYPFFLALIYHLSGLQARFFVARLVQCFVVALLAPLTYTLGKRVFPEKEKLARAAAITISLYPMLVIFPLALATEITFLPLLLGGVVLLLRAGETHRWTDYLFAGLVFGAAVLTRSLAVAVVFVGALWAWFLAKDKKGALILVACVIVMAVPWSVRNSRLHEEFVFIENSLGYNLYLGYHPETDGRFEFGPSIDLMPYLDDAERDRLGTEKAIEFIKDDPGRVPYLMVRKFGYFMGLERRALTYFYSNNLVGFIPQPYFTLVFLLFTIPFALISLSTVFGLPFFPWKKETILVAGVFLAYLGPHIVILADDRLHLAMVPFLAVTAAYTWTNFKAITAQMRLKKNWWKVLLAVVLVALLCWNWGSAIVRDLDKLIPLFGPEGNKTYYPY